MKRWIGSLALALLAGAAIAQAPFTIVRPLDGAHVRETVKIMIPKGSIPENGYIGVFIDGKFIEAVRPPLKGKYFEYDLDTQARGIADSPGGKPYKLEIVLFTEYNNQPRIVDRSSVDVYVANKSSIPVPNSGFSLRYIWKAGAVHIYDESEKLVMTAITTEQENLHGRPAELENAVPFTYRLMYACDRVFPDADGKVRRDSDGLVRVQPVPDKGKDYIIAPANGNPEPSKFMDVDLAPIYMRLSTTGHQIWGTIPEFSNSALVTGRSSLQELFSLSPLPSLPVNNVRPGDSWRSRFQEGISNALDKRDTLNSLVETYPARGEFVDVQWQMGHPCAVIKNTISESETSTEAKALETKSPGITPRKIKEEETVYFGLDNHLMMRLDKTVEIETEGTSAAYGFTGGGAAGGGANPQMGGGPPGMGTGGFGGPPPGAIPPGGGGAGNGDDFANPFRIQRGFTPGGQGMGPGGPGMGPMGRRPGGPGFGGPGMGGPGSGATPSTTAIVRILVTESRVLEQ